MIYTALIVLWWNEKITNYCVTDKKKHSWSCIHLNQSVTFLLKMGPNVHAQKYTFNKLNDQFWWDRKLFESVFFDWSFFLWVMMIDSGWWLFWTHLNRACLIYFLDSATHAAMGKSRELSIELKEQIIDLNKSGKSLGAISKQLKVLRSTVQTVICKYFLHGTVQSLPQSARKCKLSSAAERKLVRMVKSQTKPQKSKSKMN